MLPSGGYIIIEPTEALVSIDVNTGRYTGKKDPEKTILRTNIDAAREIARQLRLRDIGGIIVCDFIDMETKQNRERFCRSCAQHLSRDRARTKAFQVSELGLIEMTRQRVRPSLYQSQTDRLPLLRGSGRIFTPETVVRRIERAVRRISAEGEGTLAPGPRPPGGRAVHAREEPGFLRRSSARTASAQPARRPAHAAGRVPPPVGSANQDVHAEVRARVRSEK
jgi:hypothetical protein